MELALTRRTISSAAARALIEAAEKKAQEIGVPMVIAVCDEGGTLAAFSRM
ncbi:MAG TPA: heme-binding protein, partial [Dehalococcoidia bacterium]|nr:heme-binding protein [Dehalococcoidia bacterium]